MSEMVERVARAIDPLLWEQLDCPLVRVGRDIMTSDAVQESFERARAAIEAMRGPSDAMMNAMEDAAFKATPGLDTIQGEVPAMWVAMIDAALKEPA